MRQSVCPSAKCMFSRNCARCERNIGTIDRAAWVEHVLASWPGAIMVQAQGSRDAECKPAALLGWS